MFSHLSAQQWSPPLYWKNSEALRHQSMSMSASWIETKMYHRNWFTNWQWLTFAYFTNLIFVKLFKTLISKTYHLTNGWTRMWSSHMPLSSKSYVSLSKVFAWWKPVKFWQWTSISYSLLERWWWTFSTSSTKLTILEATLCIVRSNILAKILKKE